VASALAPVAGAGAGGGAGERWNAGVSPSPRTRHLRPIGWADDFSPPCGLRTYPRAPIALSLVDSVVFGRDIDNSGDSYFDEGFKDLFRNSAGSASWEQSEQGRMVGKRTYGNCPGQQSLIGKVAFPDAGAAGGTGAGHQPSAALAAAGCAEGSVAGEDFSGMFPDSAGMPSWSRSPRRGLKRVVKPTVVPQRSAAKEQELPPEWKLLAPNPRAYAARVPSQQSPGRRSVSQRPPGRLMASQGQSLVINSSRHR